MKRLIRPLALVGGALMISAAGVTGVAFANAPASGGSQTNSVQSTQDGEGDADQAAQDAACKAAGLDPDASNIQYDDQTGVCTLDGGGTDN